MARRVWRARGVGVRCERRSRGVELAAPPPLSALISCRCAGVLLKEGCWVARGGWCEHVELPTCGTPLERAIGPPSPRLHPPAAHTAPPPIARPAAAHLQAGRAEQRSYPLPCSATPRPRGRAQHDCPQRGCSGDRLGMLLRATTMSCSVIATSSLRLVASAAATEPPSTRRARCGGRGGAGPGRGHWRHFRTHRIHSSDIARRW